MAGYCSVRHNLDRDRERDIRFSSKRDGRRKVFSMEWVSLLISLWWRPLLVYFLPSTLTYKTLKWTHFCFDRPPLKRSSKNVSKAKKTYTQNITFAAQSCDGENGRRKIYCHEFSLPLSLWLVRPLPLMHLHTHVSVRMYTVQTYGNLFSALNRLRIGCGLNRKDIHWEQGIAVQLKLHLLVPT